MAHRDAIFVPKLISSIFTNNKSIEVMKNIFTFAALALISFTALTSCTKSATTTGYSMNVNIGGAATAFNNSLISVSNNSVTGAKTYIIEGLNNEKNYPYVYLYVPSKDTGTFAIGNYSMATHAIYAVDTLTIKQSVTGYVRIDTSSTFVSGTYSFTCADGTKLTSGSFHSKTF